MPRKKSNESKVPEVSIDISRTGKVTTIKTIGEIDISTSGGFRSAIEAVIADGAERLIFDLSDTQYLDSTGLTAIATAVKQLSKEGKPVNVVAVCSGNPRNAVVNGMRDAVRHETIHLVSTVSEALSYFQDHPEDGGSGTSPQPRTVQIQDSTMSLNTYETETDIYVIEVSGMLDTYTSPTLKQEIVGLLNRGIVKVVIDLAKAGYMDTTGLGLLVGALKRFGERDGHLTVVATDDGIRRIFTVTGLDRVFDISHELSQAIKYASGERKSKIESSPSTPSVLSTPQSMPKKRTSSKKDTDNTPE